MKNLISFDEYANQPVNEGVVGRFFIKTLLGILNTLFNIKSLITKGKVTPYWTVNVLGNVIDFFLKLKRNVKHLENYEGNILDEYTELHGHTIFDDLNRLKAHQEGYLEGANAMKRAKIRTSIQKIDEIIDMCNDINDLFQPHGIGNRQIGGFQARLNRAAAERDFEFGEEEDEEETPSAFKESKLNEEYRVKPQQLLCNDCGSEFPEFKSGGFRWAKIRKKCPYCKSENVVPAPKPAIAPMPMRIRRNDNNEEFRD
jgi:hypothetical protein